MAAAAGFPPHRPGAELAALRAKPGLRLPPGTSAPTGHGRPRRARLLARLQEATGHAAAEAQTAAEERARRRHSPALRLAGPLRAPPPQPLLQPGQRAAGGRHPPAAGAGPAAAGGREPLGSVLLAGRSGLRGGRRVSLPPPPHPPWRGGAGAARGGRGKGPAGREGAPAAIGLRRPGARCRPQSRVPAGSGPALPQIGPGRGAWPRRRRPIARRGGGGAWVAARAGFVPLWKPHCSGRLFLNYRPGSCLCCILRSSLVQLLEAVGEDKPARRAEPSERSNVLAPTDVRNGVKNVF